MKKIRVTNDVKMFGVKNFNGKDKLVDYYVVVPDTQDRIYAFSKIYTDNSYNMCKSGIRLNDLLCTRKRDIGIMRLVKHTRFMLPYLTEEYDIPILM